MSLLPHAEPWSHDGEGVGVLVIHGFTGSPKSVKPWGEALAANGWSVRVPRLPGHGTHWKQMNLTTWPDWYGEVERALGELQSRSSQVVVMGLSMGGTLSLRLAEEHPEIAGLSLVNPAVHTERADRHLLPVLKHLIPGWPGITNDIAKPDQDEGGYSKIPMKAMSSLTDLWSIVRRDIRRVTQPLQLFQSGNDHVVEPSNAEWILANVASADIEHVDLPRSNHVATLDYDAPIIFERSADFVRRVTSA